MSISNLGAQPSLTSLSSHTEHSRPQQGANQIQAFDSDQSAHQPHSSNKMHLNELRHNSLDIVQRTLSMAYEKIAKTNVPPTDQYQAFEPLTAEKVANNILGFIERRLTLDAADGATQEELASRLEAGMSGFKKGFAEAKQKLEALNFLAPEVEQDIGNTYDLVMNGIDKLRAKFLGDLANSEPKPSLDNSASVAPDASPVVAPVSAATAKTTPQKIYTSIRQSTSISYTGLQAQDSAVSNFSGFGGAQAREFSFSLTTREGDKVYIKSTASQSIGVAVDSRAASSSETFSLEIKGDLNQDELQAINDLLGKVNDLAGQFYQGNLEAAWNQAVDLGFDTTQIQDYKLSLTQVDVQIVQTPEHTKGIDKSPQANTAVAFDRAQSLLQSLMDMWNNASEFSYPAQLLTKLAESFDQYAPEADAQSPKYKFSEFLNHRLIDLGLAKEV